ncbi:MAG: Gfo/Idh/MocA family oxidoreductase [Thermoguttaceae bacterium]|nr:Gfo/Idh/MocA family oxidoreductase [Thermoguttaceae bacterium]
MSLGKTGVRRQFLKKSVIGAVIAGSLGTIPAVHAGETSELKIALVGCGGRGCGAVKDALSADAHVTCVAAADIFPERAKAGIEGLRTVLGKRIAIPEDKIFIGFDAYKEILKLDIDVVLLATPQHFRPVMLKAAIAAGKHVFAEKPIAMDGAGVRLVLEAAQEAKNRKLNIVTGLTNRHCIPNREVIKRIYDGQIGKVVCARAQRLGSSLWKRPRLPNDTEMQYQMRNWVNFNWMAGDYINDVTIHQIDVGLWAMNDPTPTAAIGMGGRIARHGIDTGDMYDSMAVTYEFDDGRFLQAYSRQIPGTWSDSRSYIYGTKGYAIIGNVGSHAEIIGEKPYLFDRKLWDLKRRKEFEHAALYQAVRSGGSIYVNNAFYTANSTGAAVLGKLATYTGKKVTWDEMLAYEEKKPERYDWNATPPTVPNEQGLYKVALPGAGWEYLP